MVRLSKTLQTENEHLKFKLLFHTGIVCDYNYGLYSRLKKLNVGL